MPPATPRRRPAADDADRGHTAHRPRDVPASGWKDVLLRVKAAIKRDRVSLSAAGVAFYAMLALFPALIAFLSLYGLLADPQQVQQQLQQATGALEGGAGELIAQQARDVAGAGTGALSFGLAASILAALWTASSGMNGLLEALNVAYGEDDSRGFVQRRGAALLLTLAGMALFAVAILAVAVVPALLAALGLGAVGEWAVRIGRWPLLALVAVAALALVYRYGPDRRQAQWRWTSPGALAAVVLWVLASLGFSVYVANFGNYNETYGALGGVIVLLLWLFISAFIVLLGAALNAELERQTRADTTTGDPEPMGQRGAHVADHVAPATSDG